MFNGYKNFYDKKFYANIKKNSYSSAKEILSILYNFYCPKTVIDIGCGQGLWLAAAESLGSQELKGYDGNWVNRESLPSKNIDFSPVDLAKNTININSKYDLCISVEVAEHLPESSSRGYIEMLCKASDVVIFSAAVKYAEGRNHINCQWQSYWVDLFKENNYQCYDLFRPIIWKNEKIKSWYRQNTFLFVNDCSDMNIFDNLKNTKVKIPDMIHPIAYETFYRKLKYPNMRFCFGCIKRYLLNILKTGQ